MPHLVLTPRTCFSVPLSQLGVAGYGSGFVPVLDAQLYDPDLPLGSRFSYIASSVIPRQYHSTQALVSDGRVLIAGCDDLPGW